MAKKDVKPVEAPEGLTPSGSLPQGAVVEVTQDELKTLLEKANRAAMEMNPGIHPAAVPSRFTEEEERAKEEAFFKETSALVLHAYLNRQNSWPNEDQAADIAIRYTDALTKKLAGRRV